MSISDLCEVENASLVINDPRLRLTEVFSPRVNPEVIESYTDHWWSKDPTIKATASAPVGQITSLEAFGRDRFLASEFHNDFWARSGIGAERLASKLMIQDGAFASLVIQTSSNNDVIDGNTARAFAEIVPHAIQATAIMRRMQALKLAREAAELAAEHGASFVIPIDAQARPVVADDHTEAALSAISVLQLSNGTLALKAREPNARLLRLIAGCATPDGGVRGGVIRLGTDDHPDRFMIEVLPWSDPDASAGMIQRPVALVLVSDRRRRLENDRRRIAHQFGLTPAEARLTTELLAGGGRGAVAARLGISDSTARSHLTRIFDKTGTRRQSELVALILGHR
ncbi:helix-turn-helix transcriptional regulator [Antarcticimicrobium luteum]|uniref:Helix-turn-helix transcriptional regulator n=1 Tax=Antarcticimicrobium luteum TaxID=2547397 RepID=A0A4R5VAG2_9RHOB|nr:helix-turn-helix transcriptional regulator [Antarcticimicrobium luteum]TDK49001.1 helix-turn-helix transcriptional regulator [Antarcticimicrobium luteum]